MSNDAHATPVVMAKMERSGKAQRGHNECPVGHHETEPEGLFRGIGNNPNPELPLQRHAEREEADTVLVEDEQTQEEGANFGPVRGFGARAQQSRSAWAVHRNPDTLTDKAYRQTTRPAPPERGILACLELCSVARPTPWMSVHANGRQQPERPSWVVLV